MRPLLGCLLMVLVLGVGCQRDAVNRLVGPPSPQLLVTPTSLDFGGVADTDTLFISNVGDGILEWDVSTDANWIFFEADTGSVDEFSVDTVVVHIFRLSMPLGSHDADINIIDQENEMAIVDVQMEVLLPDSYTLLDLTEMILYEGQEAHYGPFTLSYNTVPSIDLDLYSWPGDYEFEVLLLEEAEYTAYASGESFEAYWSYSQIPQGSQEATSPVAIPASSRLYVVMDNSDKGFFQTDGDPGSDVAQFDFVLTMTPQE
jgi:Viral BACON domain